jgi:hypothetical protein
MSELDALDRGYSPAGGTAKRVCQWHKSKDVPQRALDLNVSPKLADEAKRLLTELK